MLLKLHGSFKLWALFWTHLRQGWMRTLLSAHTAPDGSAWTPFLPVSTVAQQKGLLWRGAPCWSRSERILRGWLNSRLGRYARFLPEKVTVPAT